MDMSYEQLMTLVHARARRRFSRGKCTSGYITRGEGVLPTVKLGVCIHWTELLDWTTGLALCGFQLLCPVDAKSGHHDRIFTHRLLPV